MKNKEADTELESRLLEILVHPCRIEDIRRELPNAGKNNLKNALDALVADGRVMKNKKNRFAVSAHYGCAAGTYLATERAFAFVAPDYPEGEAKPDDLFIPPNASGGAWHGDRVLVKVSERKNNRGRKEATVIRVLGRAGKELTGELVQRGKAFFVQPTSKKYPEIAVDKHDLGEAAVGDCVAVSISHYGDEQFMPQGVVRVDLGESGTMEAAIAAVLHENGVYDVFPNEVLEQALAIPQEVDMGTAGKRLDLRDKLIFTIDGDDAKDFDDAVSLEKLENGHYLLGVHIADVSHYVTPDSPLDAEAFRRGTSVYFPGHVVPMLPFALSNGICSLNEGEDRLAFSCLMRLDENGEIRSYKFVKSVICSRVKGVYKEINALLEPLESETDADLTDLKTKYEAVLDQLPTMDELYRKRLVLRKARGGMEIESNEAKLVMDENGRCIDIVKRDRGTSECMIEEFMLLANQCAANAGRTNKVPFVYRVHEAPDAEKMEKLSATLLACGLNAKFKNPIPTQLELAALLDETRGQPIQIPVHTGILRSMQKARYAPQPLGHYGLVLADYAHFTSPIRRYPDLAIHRILTEMLNGVSASQLQRDFNEFAQQASEKSSKQEVAAVRIERDVEDLYKAEYMHNHLGEVYTGTVAGITPRGVFVELDNTVEGFVPAAQLCKGEPQVIDGVSMLDPLTGKSWMLGSSMKIRVAAADVALGRIDFEYMVE